MNPEMMKGQIRSVILAVGGLVAGWFAAKGWITDEQLSSLMTSPIAAAAATIAAGFIWSALAHTEKNAVAVVDAIAKRPDSPVKGVVTEQTVAGRALAASIPGSQVATAGTVEAAAIAAK